MAAYFWVGGTGTWNAATTTNWAASSGGAGSAGVPTALDTATFDTNSGLTTATTVTIASGATGLSWTVTGPAVKTTTFSLSASFSIATASISGNSAINRLLIQSSIVGTPRTLTITTLSALANVDFMDITGAGTASPFTGTSIGDCGGNTLVTADTPATQTATMSTNQNWSTAGIWTSRVPLPQDNVLLSGVTGGTLTADMPRLGASIDWTGATGSPTWAFSSVTNSVFGGVTLVAGLTISGTQALQASGRGSFTLTSAGVQYTNPLTIAAPGGTYTLGDAYFSSGTNRLNINNGTFADGGFSVTTDNISQNAGTTTRGFNGTGTYNLTTTTTTTFWNFTTTTGLTFTGSPNIVLANASTNTRTFAGGGKTYGTLTYTVAGSTGQLSITGSNSFAAIVASDASNVRTVKFTAGTTTTIRNANGFPSGNAAHKTLIDSITASTHTLTSSFQQSCNYLDLAHSVADVTPKWYAGANSTDEGTNTNWIFVNAPASGGTMMMMGVG